MSELKLFYEAIQDFKTKLLFQINTYSAKWPYYYGCHNEDN